jgi:hypothetical protein
MSPILKVAITYKFTRYDDGSWMISFRDSMQSNMEAADITKMAPHQKPANSYAEAAISDCRVRFLALPDFL